MLDVGRWVLDVSPFASNRRPSCPSALFKLLRSLESFLQRECFRRLDGSFEIFAPHFRLPEPRVHLAQFLFDLLKFPGQLGKIVVKSHSAHTVTIRIPSHMGWIPHMLERCQVSGARYQVKARRLRRLIPERVAAEVVVCDTCQDYPQVLLAPTDIFTNYSTNT